METVGSSIFIRGKGFGLSFEEIVSPITTLSNPANAMMSPDTTFSTHPQYRVAESVHLHGYAVTSYFFRPPHSLKSDIL